MKRMTVLIIFVILLLISLASCAETVQIQIYETDEPLLLETGAQVDRSKQHTAYANAVLGLAPTYTSRNGFVWLSEKDQRLYQKAKDAITKVASGDINCSIVHVTTEDLGIQANYYADDLGMTTLRLDDDKFDIDNIKLHLWEKITYDSSEITNLMWTVVRDMPLEFYWFSNAVGSKKNGNLVARKDTKRQEYCIGFKDNIVYSMYFIPSLEYSADENAQLCLLNTKITGAADTAVKNAMAIVDAAVGKNDWDKLVYYGTRIKALTGYNHEATSSTPKDNSGPWEIIWVFDGDPDTKVVCEGFAKAFQYLVQKSKFTDEKLECYCMSGTLKQGSGSGGHMWNNIVCKDGVFLVDVTNCSTTPTAGGYLFLTLPVSQSDNSANFGRLTYVYDKTMNYLPDSVKKYGCNHCGEPEIYEVAVEPGCQTTGLSASFRCTRCGEILIPQEALEPLGHSWVIDSIATPTCLDDGLTEGSHCERCGEILIPQVTVPAMGHDEQDLPQVMPTEIEPGLTQGYQCTRCGEVLKPQTEVPHLIMMHHMKLPAGLTTIGPEAFAGVQAQVCIIPVGVQSIGSRAFAGSSITQLHLLCTNAEIAEDAFEGLNGENTVFFAPEGSPTAQWLMDRGYITMLE